MTNIATTAIAETLTTSDLQAADHIVIAFSGGKDSLAMILHIQELGFASKIILIHHDIDGGSDLFDWPVTPDYCRKVAQRLELPLVESGRVGGIKAELVKDNAKSGDYWFSYNGVTSTKEFTGKENTRRRFPAIAASLTSRWCSAFAKIDVGASWLRHRFNDQENVIFCTGERREESSNRAKYPEVEAHRTHAPSKRHVTHWRPVIDWTEAQVWDIIKRNSIVPHPAYRLGWGRLSCMTCIFGSTNQWASVRAIAPRQFAEIEAMEQDFSHTIHAKKTVTQLADEGEAYENCTNQYLVDLAMAADYTGPVAWNCNRWSHGSDEKHWELPAGAYGESNGPV